MILCVYITKRFIVLFAKQVNDVDLSASSSYNEKVGSRERHTACVYVYMLAPDVSNRPTDCLCRCNTPRFITF